MSICKKRHFLWSCGLLIIIGLAIVASFLPSTDVQLFLRWLPRCPLAEWLHVICPTCGLTRSILYTLCGEWLLAFEYHFLGPLLVISTPVLILGLAFKKPQPFSLIHGLAFQSFSSLSGSNIFKRKVFLVMILVYCVWGFSRNFYQYEFLI